MFSSFHTVFYKLKKGVKNDEVTAHQLKGSHEILKGSQSLDGAQNGEKGVEETTVSSLFTHNDLTILDFPHTSLSAGLFGEMCSEKKVSMKIKIRKPPKNPRQKYLHEDKIDK